MKNLVWKILPAIALILVLALVSWRDIQKGPEIPADVQGILEYSCYGCHTTGAKAEEAVNKLDFLKWDSYKKTKQVGLLDEIREVADEGAMPPEKFLKKYPQKALSDEDREKIIKWTKKEMARLMGDDGDDDDDHDDHEHEHENEG